MSAADPKRRAYERQLAKQFARGRPLAVAAEAIEELQSRFKLPTWEAWQAAAELMRQHAQPPTATEMHAAQGLANRARVGDVRARRIGGGRLHAFLSALGRWSLGASGHAIRLMAPLHLRPPWIDLGSILGPTLDRLRIDFGSIFQKAPNYREFRPVAAHAAHITNVGIVGEIPVKEEPNWSTPMDNPYNSYRRNAQGSADFCAPDLVLYDLKADFATCPRSELCVWVANQGCLGVGPGVKVAFYEEQLGLLGTAMTQGAIVAGAAELVCTEPVVDLDKASV